MVWEEPPPERRKYQKGRYIEPLRLLTEQPGQWGRIGFYLDPVRANTERNNLKYAVAMKRYKLPEEGKDFNFEITVRKFTDGSGWGLYARAVPKE
jgi:hypothetical protein